MSKSLICFICGKTNVGKSTLLNALVNDKVSIISHKPDTTRRKVMAAFENEEGQILFIDTPGINLRKDYLSTILTQVSLDSLKGNDLIYYVVDSIKKNEDNLLLSYLKKEKVPVILVINKIDSYKTTQIDKIILSFQKEMSFAAYIPVSAKDKTYLDHLIKTTFSFATIQDMPLFEKGYKSSISPKQMITELVREKIYYFTEAELPYSSEVLITHIDEKNNLYFLTIWVEKESQKKILLAQQGAIMKKIRHQATRDIKRYLYLDIKLDLFVKVKANWKQKMGPVKLLNYTNE